MHLAAQELAIHHRQAEMFNSLGSPDAGLPSYDEIMKVVREEEQRELTEKQKLQALEELGMISHKKSQITIFGHKHKIKIFRQTKN